MENVSCNWLHNYLYTTIKYRAWTTPSRCRDITISLVIKIIGWPGITIIVTINLHVCYFRAEEVGGSTSDNGSSSPADKDDSKTALIWGLSSTTSAIAKELLPESQLALSVSEELLGSIGGGANQEEEEEGVAKSLQPLSKAQGKKLRQLLLNIQDERVCQVCMNELTSSVFCPCGHHVACYHCAKQLDKCPVCRQLVGYVQYVYGSA